jgi:Mg-chelatase subunit ChlD
MRCLYCGLLQDEPAGVKDCQRCGGELAYESGKPHGAGASYVQAQMELDQVRGPAGRLFDRHLLVTLRTPEQVPAEHAAPTVSGRPPLSFIAVLDVSTWGQKLANAKEGVRHALRRLREGDSISLVIFANETRCILEPSEFSPKTIKIVESALAEINAGGMTALCSGLELGIDKARLNKHTTTLVLLLSDGQTNVGETDLEKVGLRSFQARQESILVSRSELDSYNEALMVEIAAQEAAFLPRTLSDQLILI